MKNKFLFVAATHGDEGFSIPILEELSKEFPKKEFGYDWIVGNPNAHKKSIRFTEKDLNRSAPGIKSSSIYEERRAAEIVELSQNYDFMIDLHGAASNCGIVSIIPLPTFANLVLASLFNVDKNVIWYAKSSLTNGPSVQFSKCPAIEIECGPKDLKSTSIKLNKILRDFLRLSQKPHINDFLNRVSKKEFYAVYDKLDGDHNNTFKDFTEKRIGIETFYPFMSNQYPDIICYKMKKVKVEDLFLY